MELPERLYDAPHWRDLPYKAYLLAGIIAREGALIDAMVLADMRKDATDPIFMVPGG